MTFIDPKISTPGNVTTTATPTTTPVATDSTTNTSNKAKDTLTYTATATNCSVKNISSVTNCSVDSTISTPANSKPATAATSNEKKITEEERLEFERRQREFIAAENKQTELQNSFFELQMEVKNLADEIQAKIAAKANVNEINSLIAQYNTKGGQLPELGKTIQDYNDEFLKLAYDYQEYCNKLFDENQTFFPNPALEDVEFMIQTPTGSEISERELTASFTPMETLAPDAFMTTTSVPAGA